jgi:hypothetical protein
MKLFSWGSHIIWPYSAPTTSPREIPGCMSEKEDESMGDACEIEARVLEILEELEEDPFLIILKFNRVISGIIMSLDKAEGREADAVHECHTSKERELLGRLEI